MQSWYLTFITQIVYVSSYIYILEILNAIEGGANHAGC